MTNYQEIWNKVLEKLKDESGEASFNEIFSNAKEVYKFENNYVYVSVPNELIKFRINQYYSKKIKEFTDNLTNSPIGFKFITKKDIEKEVKINNGSKFVQPDAKNVGRNLSSIYRFDNFVVGESNRFAFLTSMKVAENPVMVCNPLYIFGDVGVGKTHLMTSIGNFMLDNNINTNVVYTSSQKFAEDYFLATSKNSRDKIMSFYEKYNSADLLLVDDIQFLEGKQATQEEFFKIFEELVNKNKQIILTSDRPANSLKNVMARLKSRFTWGISVSINQPDHNLLINILKKKLSILIEDPNDVPNDVLDILANYFPSNIRDLEGALRTYVNYCICMNCPFTKDNLYIALEQLLPSKANKIDSTKEIITKAIDVVCDYYKVSTNDILSTSRKQQIVFARQMLMYILKVNLNIPLQTIGDSLGNRDHATVSHGIDKITILLKKDNLSKTDYNNLYKKLLEE